MRAVGYFVEGARKSGHKRSIGEQNQAFLDFCTRQGYEVAGTFLDTEDEAPGAGGFPQMLHFLGRADRGFTIVVVDSLGALGPDLGQGALKLLEIEQTGVPVLLAHNGAEAFRELVETWADRGEGTPVSEKVRSAMRRKAVKGEALGRPPYGYRVGPRRRLELVPEESVVVRYIFRLYLQEGMGIRKIAGQLNSENIVTRRGGRWSMVTVRDILRNRAYLGHYSRFGTTVTGSHPALVSPEDFRKVQDRLQSRHGVTRTRTVQPFLLSGLLYCGRCGNKLIGVSRRQKWTVKSGEEKTAAYRYYQCESRTNQNSCAYNTQRVAELEERLRSALAEDDQPVTRLRRAGNVDSYLLDLHTQLDRIENRMKRNRRQVEELVADAAHGHITLERMKSLGGDLAREHQDLEAELASARDRLHAQQTEAERRRHLEELRLRVLREWEQLSLADLQSALREVVDRIEVDDEDLRVFLRA
ncbi:MAG: recombinase family protein [Dehalococcoidia bacterium]|nr:recombinase family protein [Dehalococcoidia bacterium]MCZ7578563.1 recombinase family protein [Dehalococcoidia bacterium]